MVLDVTFPGLRRDGDSRFLEILLVIGFALAQSGKLGLLRALLPHLKSSHLGNVRIPFNNLPDGISFVEALFEDFLLEFDGAIQLGSRPFLALRPMCCDLAGQRPWIPL